MSKTDVFNTDFSEMSELDNTLDVNEIFADQPAIEDPEKTVEEEKKIEDEPTEKVEDPSVELDINKVLESSKPVDEGTKEDVKKDEITDDGAPASKRIENLSSSDAPFTIIFARDLDKQGLLSSFDEDKFTKAIEDNGEATALRELLQAEVNSNIEAAKQDLDAGYQDYLKMVGKGVAPTEAGSLLELKERFNAISTEQLEEDDNIEKRKALITDYFSLTTQMSTEKIKQLVNRSVDMGDDVEDSKEYLEALKKLVTNNIKQQEDNAVEQTKRNDLAKTERLEELRDGINAINEIIPGQKVNKQTKQEMYGMLIKPVQDKNGRTTNQIWAKRAEDPMFFDSRIAYLLHTGYFEKDKPWDKIKNIKTSKEASELEDYLSSKNNTGSRSGMNLNLEKQDQNLRDIIKATGSIL
jgi:hypothetical protein